MICPLCYLYCGYIICPLCDLCCGYMICPLNILATCKYRKPSAPACPMCQAGVEDIEHFILFCPTWQDLRNAFFRSVQMFSPSLAMASNLEKMNYILDLKCPSDAISHCCAYVKRVYEGRQKLCSD